MKKNTKIWLVLAALVLVALSTAFWATAHPPPSTERLLESSPRERVIELYYRVKTVISTVNATLLILLLIIYVDIYSKTKSEFTIGLIIFSMVLLLYALFSNPLMHWFFGFRGFGLGPFAMLPDLFTCVALVVLLYLTIKY